MLRESRATRQMFFNYLQRGIAAGLFAGIAYGIYMITVGNPLTEYAHDAGHDHGHDHGHSHEHAVSETTNAIVSVGSGILWAILLGGIFAIAFYFFEPAIPGSDSVKAYVVAGAGFLSLSAVPWLVLPPAAPGAEQVYSIDIRLGIYVGMVGIGLLTAVAIIGVYKRFRQQNQLLGGIAAGALGACIGIALLLLSPTITTHPDLATELVTVYQALAALSQAAIWVLIAAGFNTLSRRGSSKHSTTGLNDTNSTVN